mmetsp:Transcript_1141/g.3287  ORF Transcript_1141/g.3287 Transcript_1141/m.3287 type:complete len:261 (+) Transcript_1141:90-872(+)
MEMDPDNPIKAVIRPRNPGESLKIAKTVLRRRDENLKVRAEQAAKQARLKMNQKYKPKVDLGIVRIEKLIKKSLTTYADSRRIKTQKKKKRPRPQHGKVVLAIRNGREGGTGEVRRMLRTMRLAKVNTLVFMPNTQETAESLHLCKPFVFWGRPSFKTIMNILHKKALITDPESPDKKSSFLSDNALIEKYLGDLGVLCTEDFAETIFKGGKNFAEVNKRLLPIRVGNMKKAHGMMFERKFTMGDLKDEINAKVNKLIGS